jgi:hypothetical protein
MYLVADARQGQRLTSSLTYARVCVWANRVWVCGHDAAGNAVLQHDDGTLETLGPTPGHWDVAFDWQGYVVWQQTDGQGYARPIEGGPVLPVPGWTYYSEGMLDITPMNEIVMCGGATRTKAVTLADGSTYLLPLWMTRGDWTIGQATAGAPGVVCYHAPTQQLWRVFTGDYQIPPRLSDDGTAAISGDPTIFSTPAEWTVEPLTPPLPDIRPFTQPKIIAPYPMANGEPSTYTTGMNSRILFSTAGLVTHPEGTSIRQWIDAEHGDPIPEYECVVYCDISQVGTIAPWLKPWQVIAWNCYVDPHETLDQFDGRIDEAIGQAEEHGLQFLLVAGCWNRGTLTDAQVLAGMNAVYEWVTSTIDETECLGVALFGLDRGTSIGQFKPLYQQCADLFSSPQGRPAFPVKPPIPPTPPGLAARKLLL